MSMQSSLDRFFAALVVAASVTLAGGCGTKAPPQVGFVGVGCYDHRNRLEATIRTPGECREAAWVWRTEPWQQSVPAPVN